MALGTLASRLTGFLRTVALAAILGTHTGVADAYNIANTTPNILYDLLLGGVLSSVVVPVLVRASREDADGGEAFARALLTTVTVLLGALTAVALAAAPLLVRLYADPHVPHGLVTTWVYWFLPQIVFYGIGATAGAVLNVRGRFGAPMATPVLNNLVVIATAVVYVVLYGAHRHTAQLPGSAVTLLGAGTTLGVVVMTVALVPSLRAVGVGLRPHLVWHDRRLRAAIRSAGWVVGYVATNQLGFVVIVHLASRQSYTSYSFAYQLFQLPYAVVTVSVVTGLLPRMSEHAAARRADLLRSDVSTGLRLSSVLLFPAAAGLAVLARPLAIAVFARGATSISDAALLGTVLAAFAVGLPAFSAFQLIVRVYYADTDTRTPFRINVVSTLVNIGADLIAVAVLPERLRVVGLAGGFTLSYLVGTAYAGVLLHRRLRGLDLYQVVRVTVRAALAAAVAALAAAVLLHVVGGAVGAGALAAFLRLVPATVGGVVVYYLCARAMRLRELTMLGAVITSRLRR